MKKLTVNCGGAIVTKYDSQIFDSYEEIVINAGSAIFSGEAYERLSEKKLTVNAGAQKIVKEVKDPIYLGEDASLRQLVDYSGCYLLAETLVIHPAAVPGLEHIIGIMAEKVYYPQSLSLDIIKKMEAEEMVAYPDEALLVREDITLNMDFLRGLDGKKSVYAEGSIEALDAEALAAAADEGIRFTCGSVYLYAGDKEAYGPLFESEKQVMIPDGYSVLKSSQKPLKHLYAMYGGKLYILGDLLVRAEEANIVKSMQGLTVEGTVRLPMELLPEFRKIGSAGEMFLYEGMYYEITGKGEVTHEQLNAALESGTGFTIVVNGVLEIADDVTAADLETIYALHYNGIIQCPGRLQPLLRQKVESGNGLLTEKKLPEQVQREDGDMINLGQWVVS